jgi:hypothetical protein
MTNFPKSFVTGNQQPPAELGYGDGPWMGPEKSLLVIAEL